MTLSNSLWYSSPKLKEHMQYCVDHPDEVNNLAKVQSQVSEVKGVMIENIEKVKMLTVLSRWIELCVLMAHHSS